MSKKNILTIMLSTVMMMLLVGMLTVAEGSTGFREDFSELVLDPAWTVTNTYPGNGYYSLTGNSLRYYVQAMSHPWDTPSSGYDPSMRLSREFSGTYWTFETKVTYYMPWSNGRQLYTFVSFGSSLEQVFRDMNNNIDLCRNADQGGGGASADKMHWTSTIDGVTQEGTVPISGTYYDTYYFRIVRKDKELTLLWSSDGQNWSSLYNTQMSDQTAGLSQYVILSGASWWTPAGSYGEYDYIHIEPLDNDNDGYTADVDCDDGNPAVHPGATEVCNGIDDNCAGGIDDGIASTPTTCGVGECASTGTLSCVGGSMVDSCTAGTPQTEALGGPTCSDGKDNDCDGLTDAADPGCFNVDLYISAVTAPGLASAGDHITVGATVNKSGSGSAAASTARIYIYGNLNGSGNRFMKLGDVSVSSFGAGSGSMAVSASVTIPSWVVPGSHSIIVRADLNDVVSEWNESNNRRSKPITIVP